MSMDKELQSYINDAHGDGYDTVELPIETAREILKSFESLRAELDDWKRQYKRLEKSSENIVQLSVKAERERDEARQDAERYHKEACQERELSADIVAEREELIIENEALQQANAALLEGLRHYAKFDFSQGGFDTDLNQEAEHLIAQYDIDQPTAPVCKTCHDVGEVTLTANRQPDEFENVPCPDCTAQGEDKP